MFGRQVEQAVPGRSWPQHSRNQPACWHFAIVGFWEDTAQTRAQIAAADPPTVPAPSASCHVMTSYLAKAQSGQQVAANVSIGIHRHHPEKN